MSLSLLRAAALAAAWLPAALVVAAPLSLDQALELAVQRSPLTRAAQAGAAGALDMARAAGQLPDPMLTAGIDNLPVTGRDRFSTNAEDMTMKRIGIAQEWVPADKRAAREAAAGAVAERERAAEKVATAETRWQVALAYIDAYYADEEARLTELNEHHAKEELAAARARLSASAGSSGEVLTLAAAVGAAEDESGDLRQQQAAALAALQRWLGVAPNGLAAPHLAPVPPRDAYVESHPAVIARQADLEVARREAELARRNRQPSWTYELSYGQRQGRPDLVSFGVSIPLPVAPAARQDRETAAKLAAVDKAELELEDARRAAAGEHAVLSSDAQRLVDRIERFQASVLAPLTQRTAATLAAYRSNQASLVMLFEARHAEVEAQRKRLSLQRSLAKAQAQLVFKPVSMGAAR